MKTLRKGEMCPIHKSWYCCGRAKPIETRAKKERKYAGAGVRIIVDEHHARGYREICSASELRRRKHALMAEPKFLICFYCNRDLRELEYEDIDLCHLESKGLGGARRDDHKTNLVLGCHSCNVENGSRRPAA